MVPMTLNSKLAKNLREVIRMNPGPKGTVVKVVEKPGAPILSGMAPNNPFKSPMCPKPDCPLPSGNCLGKCAIENILYKASCNICKNTQMEEGTTEDQVIHRTYIGETARTLRIRANQHLNDLKRCSKNQNLEEGTSWMWDHLKSTHGSLTNKNPHEDFSFDVISSHKDPMTRQIMEAVRIQKALGNGTHVGHKGSKHSIISLNRKNEYFMQRKRFDFDSDLR